MLKRVMIISGESSGELYGAFLAKALKQRNPMVDITGVGGDRMQAAGVKLISGISSAFGITEALKSYREIRETFKRVIAALKSFNPQVLVLIDYPDFNIRVAKEAKKLGIKILYYVSPQVWAWRKGRVKVIGRLIDKMAVILPFEEAIYRNADIPCEFVGHPILDEIKEVLEEVNSIKKRLSNEVNSQGSEVRSSEIASHKIKYKIREDIGLMPDKPVMILMPGSRRHEIERLMPVMVEVITAMHRLYPNYQFVIPVAPNLDISNIHLLNRGFEGCHVVKGQSIKALLASDIAVIASGTSTLQAAILGIPTVVVYKLSRLTYFLGKLIVKVKYISLVNILLDYISDQPSSANGKENLRIKELLQEDANKDNIMTELCRIIDDPEYRDEMASQLKNLLPLFASKEASARVAEMAKELAG